MTEKRLHTYIRIIDKIDRTSNISLEGGQKGQFYYTSPKMIISYIFEPLKIGQPLVDKMAGPNVSFIHGGSTVY